MFLVPVPTGIYYLVPIIFFCIRQALFGILGLLDDVLIFLLLAMYLTTIFR
jgi:hypothetical protein